MFELFCVFFGGGLFCWWCIFLIEKKNGTKRIKTNSVANKQIIGYCKMNFLHTTFLHYTIKQPSGWYEKYPFFNSLDKITWFLYQKSGKFSKIPAQTKYRSIWIRSIFMKKSTSKFIKFLTFSIQ